MIKTTYICDCCGKELYDIEDMKRIAIKNFGGGVYRQMNPKHDEWGEGDICKDCADKILDMFKFTKELKTGGGKVNE